MEKYKILITGHTGFIGSRLYERLKNEGHEVSGYDISQGDDLMDFAKIEKIIENIDIVYHIAAQADLYNMVSDLEMANQSLNINIVATQNIAICCTKYKKRLIFASTLCVYGNIETLSFEDSTLPNPSELYACSKYSAEWIIKGLQKSFGLEYTILRFATIYGENMRSALGMQVFIDQALQSKDITLHGDGLQSRTLTYVEDLVDGCIAVLEYLSESLNQVINLSTEESISAVQMASDILRETKSSSVIVKIDQRKNQTIHEDISLEKAKKLLRFKAQTKWIDGLRKVINYQKNKYEK